MDQFPIFTPDCPEGVLEVIHTVSEQETDRAGYMHPAAFARQMQALTEAHFRTFYERSIEYLNAAGLSWVIVFTQMDFARLPKLGEKIRMRVWAGKKKAVMHTRKYAFYTFDGESLLTTASLFLLMDRESRKAAADPDWMSGLPAVVIPGEPKAPKMTRAFPADLDRLEGRRVDASEIDYNGHLNNSHYLDWTQALPAEEWLKGHALKSVWIEYSREMMEGQMAGMFHTFKDDCLYVKGVTSEGASFRLIAECEADGGAHLK